MEEKLMEKAIIKLTPELPDNIDVDKINKAITNFIITEDAINYVLALDYETNTLLTEHVVVDMESDFIFKKYESGIILRKHLVGITKTSYTQVNTDDKEVTYKHGLMLESPRSSITLDCTVEEKNKYYPYLEDYYKGGNKWKELIGK